METTPPQIQVLHTYELVEAILQYLLPTDLQSAKLVCRAWQQIITRSQDLDHTCRTSEQHFSLVLIGDNGVGKQLLAAAVRSVTSMNAL